MPEPSAFKSRFRPDFDPSVQVFMATKEIFLGTHTLKQGEFFYSEDEKSVDTRRRKLLFEQRYMDLLPDKAAVDIAMAKRVKQLEQAEEFLRLVEKAAKENTFEEEAG